MVAAKGGGGDPDGNPRLRTAVLAAKAENMPQDNIKRAIQRGTGEIEGASYEEIVYEGYGPGGVAVIVDVLTDNRNRAVSEIRHAFSKNGGNLGESGSVGYMFTKKGLIVVAKEAASEDKLTEIVLDAGAEDLSEDGDYWEITTAPEDHEGRGRRDQEGRHHARKLRGHHAADDLSEARGHASQRHDAAAGDTGRARRCAERVLQLRHG